MTKGKLESVLKEKVTNQIKENIGKGPEMVMVRITKRFLIVEIHGILTTLEKQLLKLEDGEAEVKKIKASLSLVTRNKYRRMIEETIGSKAVELITNTNVKNNTSFSLVVFAEDIEKKIEKDQLNNFCQ